MVIGHPAPIGHTPLHVTSANRPIEGICNRLGLVPQPRDKVTLALQYVNKKQKKKHSSYIISQRHNRVLEFG
jgi:hypothetical protein